VKTKGQIIKVGSHSKVQNSAQSLKWLQILGYTQRGCALAQRAACHYSVFTAGLSVLSHSDVQNSARSLKRGFKSYSKIVGYSFKKSILKIIQGHKKHYSSRSLMLAASLMNSTRMQYYCTQTTDVLIFSLKWTIIMIQPVDCVKLLWIFL